MAQAQQAVMSAGIKEALQNATSLARACKADAPLEVLRGDECQSAPDSELGAAHHAVVEAYISRNRTDQALALAVRLLQESTSESITLLPASVESVLRALTQVGQHLRAVELLRAACNACAAPGNGAFNGAVDGAVRARAYGEAWDMLELLLQSRRQADKYFVSILTKSLEFANDRRSVRRGIGLVERFIAQQPEDVDEIVFNSLLNVLGQTGDMQKLQQTLGKMSEYGVPPSAVTYGTVVKAYGRAHDIEAVLKVWNEMRRRNLGVNPVTCGCVLDACVKCGHIERAMAIFQEMRTQGLHKNTVLYATLIKGLAKAQNLTGALKLYQEMRTEGVPCNLVTFNSLMDVCVRCGDLQAAALFLQDMMQMGIEPDLITFSTLIKGYSNTGEVHKALALQGELKQRGLICDEIMYNSLIDGCAKANKVQDGLRIFQDMLKARVAPSNITFSILVKLHFEAGQVTEAFHLVDDMASKYYCAPTRIVYTVLFRCCAQAGGQALSRGATLLMDLANRQGAKVLDQGMVSAVIFGCLRHNELDTATYLVQEFAAGGSHPGSPAGRHQPSRRRFLPADCTKAVAQALGEANDARGQELLDVLRRRSAPNAQVAQFESALNEGLRNSGHCSVARPSSPQSDQSTCPASGRSDSSEPSENSVDHSASNTAYNQWSTGNSAAAAVAAATYASPYAQQYGHHYAHAGGSYTGQGYASSYDAYSQAAAAYYATQVQQQQQTWDNKSFADQAQQQQQQQQQPQTTMQQFFDAVDSDDSDDEEEEIPQTTVANTSAPVAVPAC